VTDEVESLLWLVVIFLEDLLIDITWHLFLETLDLSLKLIDCLCLVSICWFTMLFVATLRVVGCPSNTLASKRLNLEIELFVTICLPSELRLQVSNFGILGFHFLFNFDRVLTFFLQLLESSFFNDEILMFIHQFDMLVLHFNNNGCFLIDNNL